MKWFSAHLIFYFRYKEGVQRTYPVWETIYLIEATGFEDAEVKAQIIGNRSTGDSGGTLQYDGVPAELIYGGMRKIVSCTFEDERPSSGTELTYSDFEVANRADLDKLSRGDSVAVVYKAANTGRTEGDAHL